MNFRRLLSVPATLLAFSSLGRAEEGMWLYTAPPREQIKARYGFELTDAWLDQLMKASVRFNSGGSGSFVSADGLVITNHHVGADAIQKLSTAENNYLRDGFHARSLKAELNCLDLELNVLQSIEDVTARVNAAVPVGSSAEDAAAARRRIIAEIETESHEKTGLRSDVVTLYQGGAYHLYRFKRYTDIRLVWAPAQQAAFFGGDPDNFEFPRYCLDACLFRVYENDRPAEIQNYLAWSREGANVDELTFVSGHPGRTDRQLTMAELVFLRDVQYPYVLNRIKRIEVLLEAWSERNQENARRAQDDLFSFQNARKAYDGQQAGLYSPTIMEAKAAAENAFQQQLREQPTGAEILAAYDRIAEAQAAMARIYHAYRLLEGGHAFMSDSFSLARQLLRATEERSKPSGERLEEYADARRQSLELGLFSDKPIYPDLEIVKLADALTLLAEQRGYNDPLVQAVLAGQSPRERAAALINGTQVRDVAFRRQLYEGGAEVVAAANDPMIDLARLVDAEARALRTIWEAAEEQKQQAHAALERARFALEGPTRAPDATFTLRLTYGTIKGYEEAGKEIPAFTEFAGLYERAAAQNYKEPFDLPQRWIESKDELDLSTPFNFVSTHDIIGGNSGSPVVNKAGEFVGIIFDGNIQSLVLNFAYEDEQARAISVDCRAIIEALRKVYDAQPLVDELLNGKR